MSSVCLFPKSGADDVRSVSLKINIVFSLLGQAQLIGEAGRERRTPNLIEGICNGVLLCQNPSLFSYRLIHFSFLGILLFSTAGHSINSMFA